MFPCGLYGGYNAEQLEPRASATVWLHILVACCEITKSSDRGETSSPL